jgi:hypothetical protein
MFNIRRVTRRYNVNVGPPSQPNSIDILADFGLTGRIVSLTLLIVGTMTAGMGGAVSGFAKDAPASLLLLATLEGSYKLGTGDRVQMLALPGAEWLWPASKLNGTLPTILRTSTGGGNTDPFSVELLSILRDPSSKIHDHTGIDVREFGELTLRLDWDNALNLATTNLASVQNVSVLIEIKEEVGLPAVGSYPNFTPVVSFKDLAMVTQDTAISDNGTFGFRGYCTALHMRQHDALGVGDAQRTDGILRKLTVYHGGKSILDHVETPAFITTDKINYPIVGIVGRPAGVYSMPFMPMLRSGAGAAGALSFTRDTLSPNPPDIVPVVAGAGDKMVVVLSTAVPNDNAAHLLSGSGKKA